MSLPIQVKRGTRAQLEAAKAQGALVRGEPYLITDENRLAVGTGPNSYEAMAREVEASMIDNIAGYAVSIEQPKVGDVISFGSGGFYNRPQSELTDGGNF